MAGQLNSIEGKVDAIAKLVLSDYHKENHEEVARDTTCGVRSECYASSPLKAKANAVYSAISHILSRGHSNVILEIDSSAIVKTLYRDNIKINWFQPM
ncbi:hypothetical protein Tco_0205891 [Tanacetum coccineum]